MISQCLRNTVHVRWFHMADIADDSVLIDRADLLRLRHGPAAKDLRVVQDVMRLQPGLFQAAGQWNHGNGRNEKASGIILHDDDRTLSTLFGAMRNTEIRQENISSAIFSLSLHFTPSFHVSPPAI